MSKINKAPLSLSRLITFMKGKVSIFLPLKCFCIVCLFSILFHCLFHV
jgi:hypothetical protein